MTEKTKPIAKDLSVTTYVKLVRTAEALHSEVSRGLMVEGLTASQFSALKVLRLHGPLAQRDIANYLLKTGGNITVVVDNLEKQGLVTRIRDTEDRRFVFVRLTEAGEELFDRLYQPHLERIRETMEAVSEANLTVLLELLEQLHPTTEAPICQPAPDYLGE